MKKFYPLHPSILAIFFQALFCAGLMASPNQDDLNELKCSATTDQMSFVDPSSSNVHQLICTGKVIRESLPSEMGRLLNTFEALTVQGKGASLKFKMKTKPQEALILEIQEIHQRRPKAFGYTVAVNNKTVYFRSYEEYGSGPNHYFVRVTPEVIGSSTSAEIQITNIGETVFSLANIWGYGEFFSKIIPREELSLKMPLYTHLSKEASHQLIQKTPYECYGPIGKLGFITYGNKNLQDTRETFHQDLDYSSTQPSPFMFIVSGYGWGGLPTGPDGLGGYFSDPRYSGLSYNPTTQKFRASWPNMWGSTPFLTITDPNMNQFLARRIELILGDLPEKIDTYKALGKPIAPIMAREWGSNGGDVTNENILAAQREGIVLDPSDGLSLTERHWLYQNVAKIWERWAKDMTNIIGRDSVLVHLGKIQPPQDHIINNMYAHADFITDHPMNNPRWHAGQMGMVKGFYSSGEMGKGTEYREIALFDYLRANGKLAMINMERTMLKDNFSVLKNHYQRGFKFLTFFNSYDGDEKFIKSMDAINEETCLPPVHKEPLILDINLERDQNMGDSSVVLSSRNVSLQNKLRLAVEHIQQQGEVVYRLNNSGGAFTSGLVLHLDGRLSPGEGNAIEVYVGNELSQLKLAKTLTAKELPCPDHWTPYMSTETSVDLGQDMVGQTETFLRLVVKAQKAPDAAFILALKVGFQWPMRSGQQEGRDFKIAEIRALQLWVQERAVAQQLLAQYAELGTKDSTYQQAEDLMARGWYKSANRLLNKAIAELLPARYVIKGYGNLGKYPLKVELAQDQDAISLTLCKFSNEEVSFKLQALLGETKARITFQNLDPKKKYGLLALGDQEYRVVEGQPSVNFPCIAESNGVSFDIKIKTIAKNSISSTNLPSPLVARCISANKDSITVDMQDVASMGYDNSLTLLYSANVAFERHNDNPLGVKKNSYSRPEALDKVQLSIDPNGRVTQVLASYGQETGRLKKYTPPVLVGELSNGILEFENGHQYSLHFDKSTGTLCDTVALKGTILGYEFQALEGIFKPGEEFEITYSPYAEKGGHQRIRHLRQKYQIVFEEDYTKNSEDRWKKKAIFSEALEVTNHHPEPNYLAHIAMQLLRPTQAFDPGTVVYKIHREKAFKNTVVEFTARAFEDSSTVEFWVSEDNKNWSKSGQFDNTWQNNIPQSIDSKTMSLPWQFIDVSPWVKGQSEFYLKMVLRVNSADERYCVAAVRVVTEE